MLEPASARSLDELATLFTRCFEGYLVPVGMTAELLAALVRADGVDLHHSRVVRHSGEDAGIVLLARRGDTVRVAAMGLVATARGQGIGRQALEALLPELRGLQVRTLLLEVIAQNTVAVRLYERLGFVVRRRLVGWSRPEAPRGDGAAVTPCDPAEAVAFLAEHGERDLPWQLQPPSLWTLGWPTRGFRLADRGVALAAHTPAGVALRAVCVREPERRQGVGRTLLAGAAAALGPASWNVPPIVPEGLADGFLDALGFARTPLWQYEMALPLAP